MHILFIQSAPSFAEPIKWSSEDWDREKAKAKEQNPFIKSDAPIIKVGNPAMDPVGALNF